MQAEKPGGILVVMNSHETIASCQGPSLLHAELDRLRLAYAAAGQGPWGQIAADDVLLLCGVDGQTAYRVALEAARSTPAWAAEIVAALQSGGLTDCWELHGPQEAITPLLAGGNAAGLRLIAPLVGRITGEQLNWLRSRSSAL